MSQTKTTYWQNIKHRLLLLCPPRSRKYVTNIVELKDKPHKILCASSSGIGDFVMVAPAIQALKEKFPNSKMVYLAHYNYGGCEVSKLIPAIDYSIDIALKKYRFASATYMLWRYWKVLHCLRRENCDLAIVFTPNYILRWLLAGLNCKNWIYGNTISGYPGTIASDLLKLVNINEQPKSNIFDIPAPVRAKELLPANLPRPLIGVHPFCGFDWMQWEKFEELQRQLCKLNGTVVAVGEKKMPRPLKAPIT